jgi:hypothetical protein
MCNYSRQSHAARRIERCDERVGISKNKTAMFRRQHPSQSDKSQDERGAQAVIPIWDIMKSSEASAVWNKGSRG